MGFVFLVFVKEKSEVLKRLYKSFNDVDLVNFLNNYTIQNNLPFSKNRKGLLDAVYPELKKFSPLYFSQPFDFLKNVNILNAYIVGGLEVLESFLSYSEKNGFVGFVNSYQKTVPSLVEFYDDLTTLVRVYACQNSVKPSEILEDKSSLRNIHRDIISPEAFRCMEDERWDLFVSLLKVLPDESDYVEFFEDLYVKATEANRVMAGYADNFDEGVEFISPRVMGVAEDIIKSEKLCFFKLEEGLKFFKEEYHDRVVGEVLKTYF